MPIKTLSSKSGHVFVHRVEEQSRLRLNKVAESVLSGLNALQVKFHAIVGPRGGIQLVQKRSPDTESLLSALLKRPPRSGESRTVWVDALRYESTSCEMEFTVRDARCSIVLPRAFRELGLLPDDGEIGVLFVAGEVIEIWKGEDWKHYVQKIGGNLETLTAKAIEEFEHSTDQVDIQE